jgi:uncharacterized protein (DUF2252 family)
MSDTLSHPWNRTRQRHRDFGRSCRAKCPRSSHGDTIIGSKERDPLALLEESNKGRLEHLIPVRSTRMSESPLAFYRGSAVVQAQDLVGTPSSGIIVQSCGDCHLMNFGAFASPERALIFDINDFDETLEAPFEWDLKRLAASLVLAARWRGFHKSDARETAEAGMRGYCDAICRHANMKMLEVWYDRTTVAELRAAVVDDEVLSKRVDRVVSKAAKQTSEVVFEKLTEMVDGRPRIIDQPPLLYHTDHEKLDIEKHVLPFFERYRATLPADLQSLFDRFHFVDAAVKVVGVGSVGTHCYIALFLADDEDPLFLQVKEARRSVLDGRGSANPYKSNSQRVVEGQRLMQSAHDIFLGWARGEKGGHAYVRQMRDGKASVDLPTIDARGLRFYAGLCGMCLGRAHARAGHAAVIAGYIGKGGAFVEALSKYAVAYADQVEADFESFQKSTRAGRFPVETLPTETEQAIR